MLKNYLDREFTILPANNKKHVITKPKKDLDEYLNWKWQIDEGYLVIDADGTVGKGSMIKLLKTVGFNSVELERIMTVATKNGGYHLYIKLDKDYIINRHYKDYPKLEFFKSGTQVMIAGSEGYRFTEMMEKKVERNGLIIYNITDYKNLSSLFSQGIKEPVDNTLDFIDVTPEEVISDLEKISPDCTYETWFKVGTAIYNWNNTETGFKVWNDWSSKGSSYPGQENIKNKWEAFKTNNSKSKNSLASIKQMAVQESKDSVFSNIYWVNDDGNFYDCVKRVKYNKVSFDMNFGHLIEKSGSASNFWSKKEDKLTAQAFVFNPKNENIIIIENDSTYINTFNKNKILQGVDNGKTESVKMFLNHIKGLAGVQYHEELLYFLAFICQNVGVRKGWAPFIIGDQGIGKTYVYDILTNIFSKDYAYTLQANAIDDKFDDFKNNKLLLLFDEVQSSSKKQTYNKLKALITDEEISFEAKGKPRKAIKNYMNCMFVSNYNECITIDSSDRRLFVLKVDSTQYYNIVITHWAKKNDMEDYHPEEIRIKYFEALHKTKEDSAEILGYLKSLEIPDEFLKSSKAPDTVYKKLLLPTGDISNYIDRVKSFLKDSKSDFYNETCIIQSVFWEDFINHVSVNDSETVNLNTYQKGAILRTINFVQYGNTGVVKINGKSLKVFHIVDKKSECAKFISKLRNIGN